MLQSFGQLENVDLSYNELIELNSAAFWGSIRLTKILLGNNNLRKISKNTFKDQVNILFKN
ncbi:unnamed protein product [Meloidogyne enterolobii]|uniref:Uncharacterized protein n=1 Tax=Meloidogyne enterolobii TaxID=390850 RepID=A0ACB0YMP5_MELEN